jgi:hypothetical protein
MRTATDPDVILELYNSSDPAYIQLFQELQTFVQDLQWIDSFLLCHRDTWVGIGAFQNLRLFKCTWKGFGCCIRRVLGPRANNNVKMTDHIERVWRTNNRLCHGLARRVESIEVEELERDWYSVTLKLRPGRTHSMPVSYALPGDDVDSDNEDPNDPDYRP